MATVLVVVIFVTIASFIAQGHEEFSPLVLPPKNGEILTLCENGINYGILPEFCDGISNDVDKVA